MSIRDTGPGDLSADELATIAASALLLDERIALPKYRGTSLSSGAWRAYENAWRRRVARADRGRFAVRQSLQEASVDRLREYAGTPAAGAWIDIPPWARALNCEGLIELRERITSSSADLLPDWADHTIPFVHLWTPFVHKSWRQLSLPVGLRASEMRALQTGYCQFLLRSLSELGLPVLIRAFTSYRNASEMVGDRSGDQTRQYREFISSLACGGLKALFVRFPVWARLVGNRLHLTRVATQRFLDHLGCERDVLARHFHGGKSLLLRALQMGCSDPHEGGQTVIKLAFAGAPALFYKPRGSAGHLLLGSVLGALNDALDDPYAVLPSALLLHDHSWMAEVSHRHARSEDELRLFHRRAGVLLCALYVTDATDMHADNLIADGPRPVPVDTESLMHPRLRAELTGTIRAPSDDDSVMRTGLLPRWALDAQGQWYSQAGLSEVCEHRPRVPTWSVNNCNTDTMSARLGAELANTGRNAPWPSQHPSESERIEHIVDGFHDSYQAVLARDRHAFFEPILRAAQVHRARFVFRPTRIYSRLAHHLMLPEFLRDGVQAQLALEILYRPFLDDRDSAAAVAPLIRSEMTQLMCGDVPCFYVGARSDEVQTRESASISNLLDGSPLASLKARIDQLGTADLARQCQHMRAALAHRPVAGTKSVADDSHRQSSRAQSRLKQPQIATEQVAPRSPG